MRAHVSHQVNDFKRRPEVSEWRKKPANSRTVASWRRRNSLATLVLLGVIAFRLVGPAQTTESAYRGQQQVVQTADWFDDILELLRILGIGGGSGGGSGSGGYEPNTNP
jgi:hypothetical protein